MSIENAPVTERRKRYTPAPKRTSPRVFACVVCDCLTETLRSHSITCSPACRVKLHRNPELAESDEGIAQTMDVPLPTMLDARAVRLLEPEVGDLPDRIYAGTITLVGAADEIHSAYERRVMRVARMMSEQGDIAL